MSFGDWFRYYCLGNLYFWWVAFVAASTVAYPFIRRFRLWQSRRRFMESQSVRLANPQNADVRFQLANLYAEGGSWGRASEHAREAVRVAGENPLYDGQVPYHFLLLLGQALYHRGLFGESVQILQQALQVKAERGYADARFGLGKARYRKGEAAMATEAYRLSIEENQSNLEAYFRLAQVAADLGKDSDVGAAREEFRRVAASLPRFAGRRRFRWRMAFLFFPITRRLA
jgi:tetratricopeptide (TPR) repeat protein